MPLFFESIETLDRFTLEIERHQDIIQCHHCLQSDQFISHGFVYKKQLKADASAVAKRIFCSNRGDRKGCGHTRQLYLSTIIPRLRYSAVQLFIFLSSLMADLSITAAYQKATSQVDGRPAFHWMSKLMHRLSNFRTQLPPPLSPPLLPPIGHNRCQRLQLLLPTLKSLFTLPTILSCTDFQTILQQPFM